LSSRGAEAPQRYYEEGKEYSATEDVKLGGSGALQRGCANFAMTEFYEVGLAPARYPWAPLAEIGCLEGYYLTFPRFLIIPIDRDLPHGPRTSRLGQGDIYAAAICLGSSRSR
jgi:hypothetical protein